MRKLTACFIWIFLLIPLLAGCVDAQPQIVATTAPVWEFTSAICAGTDLQVGLLVTENVSCLHDYTLKVSQMRMVEAADVIVVNGAGLEDFLDDVLSTKQHLIDSSVDCHLHEISGHGHDHDHAHAHAAENDPHIWLSPENAKIMAQNICAELTALYPQYADTFAENFAVLSGELDRLQAYGEETLRTLTCRELITFHDGFAYFAESFDLTILHAIEEESGSEASAQELKQLINLVNDHHLPAVFTEQNGSVSAADVICAETHVPAYSLDMGMAGSGYFEAMYENIHTIKEALG